MRKPANRQPGAPLIRALTRVQLGAFGLICAAAGVGIEVAAIRSSAGFDLIVGAAVGDGLLAFGIVTVALAVQGRIPPWWRT